MNERANERNLTERKKTHEDENPKEERCSLRRNACAKTKHDKQKSKTARNARGKRETTRNEYGDRPAKTITEEGKREIMTSRRERLTQTKSDDDNERSNSYTTKNLNDTDVDPAFPRNNRSTAPRQTSGTLVMPRKKTRRTLS